MLPLSQLDLAVAVAVKAPSKPAASRPGLWACLACRLL